MSSSKGQIYSVDFIFGMLVFIFVLVSFFLLWTIGLNRLSYFESERWRDEAARTAVEQLIESPGYPSHWEQISYLTETNLRSLGLAEERNVINHAKLSRFLSLQDAQNYTFIKGVLGIKKYDAYLEIEDLDGNTLDSYHTPPPSDEPVSTVSRLALYNESIVVVKMYVW